MGNILKYLGFAKYAVPVIDAIVAEVKVALPTEKADVIAAYEALEKTWTDFKSSIEHLIAAVRAATGNAPTA